MRAEAARPTLGAPRIFLDSNVLLYAYSETDPHKRARARTLADDPGAIISTQVPSEFANVVLRKFGMPVSEARRRTAELAARCEVFTVTPATVMEAFLIRERFGFGFFDSPIVASALASGATTLHSEDLHHGRTIDDILRIVSPVPGRRHEQNASRSSRLAPVQLDRRHPDGTYRHLRRPLASFRTGGARRGRRGSDPDAPRTPGGAHDPCRRQDAR